MITQEQKEILNRFIEVISDNEEQYRRIARTCLNLTSDTKAFAEAFPNGIKKEQEIFMIALTAASIIEFTTIIKQFADQHYTTLPTAEDLKHFKEI